MPLWAAQKGHANAAAAAYNQHIAGLSGQKQAFSERCCTCSIPYAGVTQHKHSAKRHTPQTALRESHPKQQPLTAGSDGSSHKPLCAAQHGHVTAAAATLSDIQPAIHCLQREALTREEPTLCGYFAPTHHSNSGHATHSYKFMSPIPNYSSAPSSSPHRW